MPALTLRAALCAGAVAFVACGPARAHEIVGNRMFPATLAIDDPGVADELTLPTVSMFKTGDDPSVKQRDISAEFSKRITEDFPVSFAPIHTKIYAPGGPAMTGASGFQNLETTFKYRLYQNPEHEFVMSTGLNGAAAAPSISAPNVSRSTRRRSMSAKASAICPRAWAGRGRSRSQGNSAMRSPGPHRIVLPASIPIPAIPVTIPNFTHACWSGAPRSSTACPI
jgi:hypothetical protein